MTRRRDPPSFIPVTVLKRDVFSETVSGHLADAPERRLLLRRLGDVPLWSLPIARYLARRELRAFRAAAGIEGVPAVISANRWHILREWSDGTPLQLVRPSDAEFYRRARKLLRDLRRAGVTHNDLAKPQNWLVRADGSPGVIDFQLARVHRRRGRWFRTMAREDLRHLLKQKKRYARHLLTPSEERLIAKKSLAADIWMATVKPVYNFVTRRLFNWSDSEGAGARQDSDTGAVADLLSTDDRIRDFAIAQYSLPSKGVGLYVFAETDLDAGELRKLVPKRMAELVQPVSDLPRREDGTVRDDALALIAANRLDELKALQEAEPQIATVLAPIIAARLNLTDRLMRQQRG